MVQRPTLTLHNFSFRPDPLNAPKGQEIIHAVDEQVEIFPKIDLPVEKPKKETPTSLNPALSGGLKVKLFGKMKEKNTFETAEKASEELMEIEDEEDFELENPSPVQSLGNSGVTITPISHLNKKRNVQLPISGPGLELKKMKIGGGHGGSPLKENKPFTLGNSSTTITSALGSSSTSVKKSTPSVTLTPTGNTGKRLNIKSAPLRPIESQSVVNIAGKKIFSQF